MKNWFDFHGLLHAGPQPRRDENSFTFTPLYLLFGRLIAQSKHNQFSRALLSAYNKHGMLDNYPNGEGPNEYTSHDTLTGVVAYSKVKGLRHHVVIWEHLVRHWFTYDNRTGRTNFRRIMHPRDIIFYGACANNIICKAMLPLLSLICIISCLKTKKVRYQHGEKKVFIHTDGKNLVLLRCKALKMKITFKICTYIIEKKEAFGSWAKIQDIYFRYPGHPLRDERRMSWTL